MVPQGRARTILLLVTAAIAAIAITSPASAAALMSFDATADTYVHASSPDTSFGAATSLGVDGVPLQRTFLRFDVSGLGGRTVTGVRLRMYQRGDSVFGGRVHFVPSNSWTDSITWNTQPQMDTAVLGSFGAVSAGSYYDLALPSLPVGDGPLSLGIDSTNANGAYWGSLEMAASPPPRLILEVESPADMVMDGLSQVMGSLRGSSDPTYYPANHRMVTTAGGRLLEINGRHASGVQLVWRDPAGNWQTQSTGTVPDGGLITGMGTGDLPASMAVARDSNGAEHAWFVGGRQSATSLGSVYLRRLSNLDSPAGPSVGPLMVLDSPSGGAFKPDLQFERAADGTTRGLIVWGRGTSSGYETVVGSFTDLDTDLPAINDIVVLESGSSSNRWATLVPDRGMSLIMRGRAGALIAYHHADDAPATSWTHGTKGASVLGVGGAAALASGEVLAAVESDLTNDVVIVQRFSASGQPHSPVELQLSGYSTPSIASDGFDAWLVMVRRSDGYVVSRQYTPLLGWSSRDRVEIGPEGGGNYDYPNVVRQTDGRLRLTVRGPAGPPNRSAVLAFQRPL